MALIYVDGAQVDASNTTPLTLSPTIPATTAAGDTLVAIAAGDLASGSSGSIAMGTPTGWTALGAVPTGVGYLSWGTGSASTSILRTTVTDTSTDIDIKALCRKANWAPSSGNAYLANDTSSSFNWLVSFRAGDVFFSVRSGSTIYTATSSPTTLGLTNGQWAWLRFTYDNSNRARFWTSADGISWSVAQTSTLSGATTIAYAAGTRAIQVGASGSGATLGFDGDIAAFRVSSSTNSTIADLGLAGLTVPSNSGWTAPLGTAWSTLSTPKSWTANGAGSLFAFHRTAATGDAGTSVNFTFPAAFGVAGLHRSVRLMRFSGSTTGIGTVMTDTQGFQVSASTWQPSSIASVGTRGTYVLAEYRSGTASTTPIITANGWTLDSGTLANNAAATLRQQNVAAPSSPVLVSSAGVRAALGVGFSTTTDDWGIDRIAW